MHNNTCSYCKARGNGFVHFGRVCLCPTCEGTLCVLSCEDGAYSWFAYAVKKEMFLHI